MRLKGSLLHALCEEAQAYCFALVEGSPLDRSPVTNPGSMSGGTSVMFDKSVNEFESRRRLKSPFDKGGFSGILLWPRLQIPPTPLFQKGGIVENGQQISHRISETQH